MYDFLLVINITYLLSYTVSKLWLITGQRRRQKNSSGGGKSFSLGGRPCPLPP